MRIAFAIAAMTMAAASASAAYSFNERQTSLTAGWADAIAVGDVTGDGRDDVVVSMSDFGTVDRHHVYVYAQRADGSLALPQKHDFDGGSTITGVTLADMNRDGILDIVIGHAGISILSSDRRRPGVFRARHAPGSVGTERIPAYFVGALDVDRDGLLDVVGASWMGAAIYYGNGAGGVREVRALDPGRDSFTDMEVGDVNDDGFDDLVVAYGQPPDYMGVYYHDGIGGFAQPVHPLAFGGAEWHWYPEGIAVGDFNGDGRMDIATGNGVNSPFSRISLFYQNADGSLAPYADMLSADMPGPMFGADFTGDGREDLLVNHDGWNAVGLYQQGQGGFGLLPERGFLVPASTRANKQGLASGDVNGDGCMDLAIANYNYGLVVMHGTGCPARGDVAVALARDEGAITVGVASASAGAAIRAPLLELAISVRTGTLQTGPLPAGCAIQASSARSQRIECLLGDLPAGATTALEIPVQTSRTGLTAALEAVATVRTDTPEWALANNTARRRFDFPVLAVPKRQARGSRGMDR